jgi:hypothetical protein
MAYPTAAPYEVTEPPLPGADDKVPLTIFYIDDFRVK